MIYSEIDTLVINDKTLRGEEIVKYCLSHGRADMMQLGLFIKEWLGEGSVIELQTSGSTGQPKIIHAEKKQMLASAALTAEYFKFEKGQTALLCLPVQFIAGKMMVVRAMLSGLNLICMPSSGNPLASLPDKTSIDFAPLLPMQLDGAKSSSSIKKILLGGAPVNPLLEKKLQSFTSEIYHGYGMTETLSHVALRRMNGIHRSDVFQALEGIYFETNENDCLVIHVPFLPQPVTTNDIVELHSSTSFTWKGRADYVVNSGGVKLFPETIERKIAEFIKGNFFLSGIPDERLGERLCLFIEGNRMNDDELSNLKKYLSSQIGKFENPRSIIFIPEFQLTSTGKVNRSATIQIYLNK